VLSDSSANNNIVPVFKLSNGKISENFWLGTYPERGEDEKDWPHLMDLLRDYEKSFMMSSAKTDAAQYTNLLNTGFLSGSVAQGHPWWHHIRMYQANLQIYNLWHEDRTAAGNSIENRVPFLDHRLVEYTAAIPPRHYAVLFWDKRILREAMRQHLPRDLAERPKVPFFCGEDVRYTRRMIYELLLADDRALLREAFGDADGSHPVFERDAIEHLITDIPDDPEYEDMSLLLQFANMGLLAQMAKAAAPVTGDTIPVLRNLPSEEWAEDEIALRLALRRKDITPDRIPELAEGVLLLTTGNPVNTEPPCWHILINGVI